MDRSSFQISPQSSSPEKIETIGILGAEPVRNNSLHSQSILVTQKERFHVESSLTFHHTGGWIHSDLESFLEAIMDGAEIQAFKERIREEANQFHNTSYTGKGFEDGQREASQWSYEQFLRYQKIVENKKGTGLTEQEIEELYSSVKSKQSSRLITVDRIEAAEGFEGVYRITEKKNDDPLEQLPAAEKSEYLKGWLSGIEQMWRIALKALSW